MNKSRVRGKHFGGMGVVRKPSHDTTISLHVAKWKQCYFPNRGNCPVKLQELGKNTHTQKVFIKTFIEH